MKTENEIRNELDSVEQRRTDLIEKAGFEADYEIKNEYLENIERKNLIIKTLKWVLSE